MNIELLPILLILLPPIIIVYSLYSIVKNAGSYEKSILDFIARKPISASVHEYLVQDKLANFQKLIATGKTIAAAKEYKEVMNASLAESRLAVKISKSLFK